MFKVEGFSVVAKPVFEVCFGGPYVNFLLIVKMVRRDLHFINDVWS